MGWVRTGSTAAKPSASRPVEIRIRFDDPDLILPDAGNRVLQHLQCGFLVPQMAGEHAGEIVSHVEVVWIDQKGSIDPFASTIPFAKERMTPG